MSTSTTTYTKCLIAGGLGVVADRFVLMNQSVNSNVMLGASSALGIYVGVSVSGFLPDISMLDSSDGSYTSKGILNRVAEIGSGLGASYVLNRYLFHNDLSGTNEGLLKRVAIFSAIDVGANYITEYIYSSPLVLFNGVY
jgi:putative flippase GtrA